jgi:hypothetical protein
MFAYILFAVLHMILIVLAATDFTLITHFLGPRALEWSLFSVSYRTGFGSAYVSEFSVSQILAYLAGYTLGLPVYVYAWRYGWKWLGFFGTLLCLLGAGSFLLEGAHFVTDFHYSVIFSLPVVMVVLCVLWFVMLPRVRSRK